MEPKVGGIKGVNIANIILLVIVVILSICGACFFGNICDFLLSNAELKSLVAPLFSAYANLTIATPEQAIWMISSNVYGIAIAYCIMSGVMIAGAIVTINRASKRPKEIGGVIGWSVAGIVLSLLSGLLISCILWIVSTVLISKAKNAS